MNNFKTKNEETKLKKLQPFVKRKNSRLSFKLLIIGG